MRTIDRNLLGTFVSTETDYQSLKEMDTNKELYECPRTEVLKVHAESIICLSGGDYNNPFGNEQIW